MRRLILFLVVGLAAACSKRGGHAAAHRAQPGDIAIVGATVVPMDRERALPGHTVLVRGDRIVALAPSADVDVRLATVVDATDAWVLPGLVDMHVHLWSKRDLDLFLLNGVTTVRDLFGEPARVRWRDAIAKGELAGPTILTAGPILDGDPPVWPGSDVVTTADQARAAVQAQKQAGYDWLKVYSGLSADVYAAIIDEARKVGLPVGGHVPRAVGLDGVLASGQVTIEHLDGYVPFFGEPVKESKTALTVKAGVWNCPTLVVTDRFGKLDDPAQLAGTRGLELMSPIEREGWKPANDFRLRAFTPEMFEDVRQKNLRRRELVRELNAAGAKLLLGTDTGNPYIVPGFAVVDELGLLVEAGLTPWQALRTATAAAGELQGRPGELGVIAAGARADLIVVGKDPLSQVTNVADPSVVMVRGVVRRRDELLAEARKPPPSPADVLATLPALPAEGTAVASARYDVLFRDAPIGAEQANLSRGDGGPLVVHGHAVYTVPGSTQTTYRATRDAMELTTDTLAPPRVSVARKGGSVVATQDAKPPLELAADDDAVLAPQTIAEFVWYGEALATLAVGDRRTFTLVSVRTETELVLAAGFLTFTRTADADGRRHYRLAGRHGTLDATGTFSLDADGAPHRVSLALDFGTIVTQRVQ